jgi:uncharacterized protein YndB with AHSA1/START domain
MTRHGIGHNARAMAHNEIDIDAPPDAVFDVLSDPRSYARWVVGSRAIRAADAEWPATGTVFDHAQGIGPVYLKDSTFVLESRRPTLLRLRVQARPVSVAHVTLRLSPNGAGTHVEMEEGPADLFSWLTMNPLTAPLMRLRNAESLRRLKRLAEGQEPIPEGELPARGGREGWVTGASTPASGRSDRAD